MRVRHFQIGMGRAAGAVTEIWAWLQSCGVKEEKKAIGVYKNLLHRFGAAHLAAQHGNLYVQRHGALELVMHRDDVLNWLYGRRVEVMVGQDPADNEEPMPTAKSEQQAKVVEYDETELGAFRCSACGKMLKTEKGMISHIERDH